jgi:hypothetical protein
MREPGQGLGAAEDRMKSSQVSHITGNQDSTPVLLCGYPKSGTTLLLALLDRHPELLVFPEESKFFKHVIGHPERQNLDYVWSHTGASAFQFGEVQWASGYRDYSDINIEAYQAAVRARWERGDQSERALVECTILGYGDVTGQMDRRYWVEKTPLNERYLDRARALWPSLRAMYIVRDPRDNFCSYRKKRELGGQVLTLPEFVIAWARSVYFWRRFAHRHATGLLIRYCDLVRNPRAVMQRVCDFLQVRWDDILLKPTRNGVFWSGNSMHGMEHEGISTTSLGKYRDLLSPDEVAFLETWLGPIMQHHGWDFDSGEFSWQRLARSIMAGQGGHIRQTGDMLLCLLGACRYL